MQLVPPSPTVCQRHKGTEKSKNLQQLPRRRQINTQEIEHKVGNVEDCNEEYNKSLSARLSRLFFCLRHRFVRHTKRAFHKCEGAYLPSSPQSLAQSQNGFP